MKCNKVYILLVAIVFSMPELKPQAYDFSADATEGCDILTATFSFISTASVDTITYIIWDLGNGPLDTTYSAAETVTRTYNIPSRYPVAVYVNSYDDDPVEVKNNYITVYRTVTADFSYQDSAEISRLSVVFDHLDQPLNNSLTYTFNWDFDDGTSGTGERVLHSFDSSGTYDVTLDVSDDAGCSDSQTQTVSLIVQDAIADVTRGCDSLEVKFNLTNIDTDTITSILWDFGNGTYSNSIDPDTVLYTNTTRARQDYTLRVTINGDSTSIVKPDYITVFRTVKAEFQCADTLTTSDRIIQVCYPIDRLTDPTAVYSYDWLFENIGAISNPRPLVTYPPDPDTVSVSLTISDITNGCSDSQTSWLFLMPEILVQNVFTPNDDGINDFFMINSAIPLEIKIFTRAGLLVFQAEGTEIIWYGETATGIKLDAGIYFYVLKALSGDPGEKYDKAGFIYLYK